MLCGEFKCVFLVDGECEPVGGGCIGKMCTNWGECITASNKKTRIVMGYESDSFKVVKQP